ncbi:MAG TPA: hypothetical protein VLY87_04515 [Flavobacterium sp.]|nr:hypothetical protein [Flavobacterium sp.]
MRHLLTLTLLLVTYFGNAQKIDLTPAGFTPVVIELNDKSAEDIYIGIIKYINRNYKTPSEVLKGDIKNEYVRLDGFMNKMWCYKAIGLTACVDQLYSVELDIKEGKFRMTFTPNKGYASGTRDPLLFTYKTFFKRDGSVKNIYSSARDSFEVSVNNIRKEIVDEINGKSSNNDW